jgi:hypothetical protein
VFFVGLQFVASADATGQSSKVFCTILFQFFFLTLQTAFLPYASRAQNVQAALFEIQAILLLLANGILFSSSTASDTESSVVGALLSVLVVTSISLTIARIAKKKLFAQPNFFLYPDQLSHLTKEEMAMVHLAVFSFKLNQNGIIEFPPSFAKEHFKPQMLKKLQDDFNQESLIVRNVLSGETQVTVGLQFNTVPAKPQFQTSSTSV